MFKCAKVRFLAGAGGLGGLEEGLELFAVGGGGVERLHGFGNGAHGGVGLLGGFFGADGGGHSEGGQCGLALLLVAEECDFGEALEGLGADDGHLTRHGLRSWDSRIGGFEV